MSVASPPRVDLHRMLANVKLPALPQSAVKLLELSQNAELTATQFAAPIEADPGLAGQVLQFVNSSYFGFARKISSVKLATTLVGMRTIKNFALWSAVFSLIPNPKCGPLELKILWQDSLRRALFARELAKLLGVKEPEDVFAAALLQDMAVPLLAKETPAVYAKLLDARSGGQFRLSQLEMKVFQWNHGQAAAIIARTWNLPERFAELVETHTDSQTLDLAGGVQPDAFAVAMSALLPTLADAAWADRDALLEAWHQLPAETARPLDAVFEGIDRQFADFAPMLKLSPNVRGLRDTLMDAPVGAAAST